MSRRPRTAASPPAAEAGAAPGTHGLSRVPRVSILLGAAAVVYGIVAAWRQAWLCDDAFISFRYADNFVHGLGLVYNAGERVEGYSNFLWTLWTAIGMRLGVTPETWSVGWGIAFYAATLALLAWNRLRVRGWLGGASFALPVAAVLAALHPEWNLYATSGLETACFTFLVTLGYVLAVDERRGPRGAAASGLVFALVALERPDGLLFAPLVAIYVLAFRRPALRSLSAFAAFFLLAWLPWVAWKLTYYGDFFPNTYYAKSAAIAWYSQGWLYVRLYLAKYGAILLGLPAAAASLLVVPGGSASRAARSWAGEALLAAGLVLAYTLLVMRVGGDFMYARLLIPATPLVLILLELGLARLAWRQRLLEPIVAVAALAPMLILRNPIPPSGSVGGIVNERGFYSADAMEKTRREGAILRRYFAGLPVTMAIAGSQASLAYYARAPIVIEGQTGLTDRVVARQPLARRGRVGHEKVAPADYIFRRRVDFTVHHFPGVTLHLDAEIPLIAIGFDGVPARIVHWDSVLLAELQRRGAEFEDFPRTLDRYIAGMSLLPDDRVRDDYRRFRRFYFDWVNDPAREAPFIARVGAAGDANRTPRR
jgi:hypothetical protein